MSKALSPDDHYRERRKYSEFAREALDAMAAEDTSNYNFPIVEIPGLKQGDPIRQVVLIYDKRDQSYKGFCPY